MISIQTRMTDSQSGIKPGRTIWYPMAHEPSDDTCLRETRIFQIFPVYICAVICELFVILILLHVPFAKHLAKDRWPHDYRLLDPCGFFLSISYFTFRQCCLFGHVRWPFVIIHGFSSFESAQRTIRQGHCPHTVHECRQNK